MRGKIGFILYISAFVSSLLLAYAYRDFSLYLTVLFIFSVTGLSLGLFLILTHKSESEEFNNPEELHEECEVIGRFNIQS